MIYPTDYGRRSTSPILRAYDKDFPSTKGPHAYSFQKDKSHTFNKEEDSVETFLEYMIKPVFSVVKDGDMAVDNDKVLNLIQTLRFESLTTDEIGKFGSEEYKAKLNSMHTYISSTYMMPFLYNRYGASLFEALKETCPNTCNDTC